ncbi:MAG: 50S ribosomal protein L9 [Acidobacteria bacterium]|jgi:large subunit ribosomal protein L9|nr:50S ribosomal protein L9 [Acidobacteriota bacterium]
MKVILNDYVEHLGERGQTVTVKPGYARNYLLPKRLAYLDTPGNRRLFQQEQKTWEEMDLKRRSAAEQLAASLEGIELVFERRAGENDVLFGSVTTHDIAGQLAERGVEVDKRRVILASPFKELGSFQVTLQVHRDIAVTLPVHVVRPGEEPRAAATEEAATVQPAAEEPVAQEVVEAAPQDAEA